MVSLVAFNILPTNAGAATDSLLKIVSVDTKLLRSAAPQAVVSDPHMMITAHPEASVTSAPAYRSTDERWQVDVSRYDPVALKLVDWPIDELMYIARGQVEITSPQGASLIYRSGDSFLMPKGFTGNWIQSGPIEKISVGFSTQAAGGKNFVSVPGAASNGILSISAAALHDAEALMQPVKDWNPYFKLIEKSEGRFVEMPLFKSSDGKTEIHVKRFEKITLSLSNWPIDEYMHFLKGRVQISAAGLSHNYGPGDTLVIPKGFTGTWRQLDTVDMITVEYNQQP